MRYVGIIWGLSLEVDVEDLPWISFGPNFPLSLYCPLLRWSLSQTSVKFSTSDVILWIALSVLLEMCFGNTSSKDWAVIVMWPMERFTLIHFYSMILLFYRQGDSAHFNYIWERSQFAYEKCGQLQRLLSRLATILEAGCKSSLRLNIRLSLIPSVFY